MGCVVTRGIGRRGLQRREDMYAGWGYLLLPCYLLSFQSKTFMWSAFALLVPKTALNGTEKSLELSMPDVFPTVTERILFLVYISHYIYGNLQVMLSESPLKCIECYKTVRNC